MGETISIQLHNGETVDNTPTFNNDNQQHGIQINLGSRLGVTCSEGTVSCTDNSLKSYNPSNNESSTGDQLLDSARHRLSGRFVPPTAYDQNTTFSLNGVSLTADNMVTLGILQKGTDGSYRLAQDNTQGNLQGHTGNQQSTQGATESNQGADSPYVDGILGQASVDILNEITQRTGSVDRTDTLIASALGRLYSEQGMTEADYQRIGAEMGAASADHASDAIETIYTETFSRSADFIGRNYGLDGKAVLESLGNLPGKHRADLAYRFYLGDRSAFHFAVTHYRATAERERRHSNATR